MTGFMAEIIVIDPDSAALQIKHSYAVLKQSGINIITYFKGV